MKVKMTISKIIEPSPMKNSDGTTSYLYPFLVKEIQRDQFDEAVIYSVKPIPEDAKKVTAELKQITDGKRFVLKFKNIEFE